MHDQQHLSSLPYPLRSAHTDAAVRCDGNTLEHVHTLLEQTLGLAGVSAAAARSDDVSAQDLVASLEVLSGYLESTLAIFEEWEEAEQAQEEAAAAQRQAWVDRPAPQEIDSALTELREIFEQCNPSPAAFKSLITLLRRAVPASGIPPDSPLDSPEEAGA
jgi:hypothetical protein